MPCRDDLSVHGLDVCGCLATLVPDPAVSEVLYCSSTQIYRGGNGPADRRVSAVLCPGSWQGRFASTVSQILTVASFTKLDPGPFPHPRKGIQ